MSSISRHDDDSSNAGDVAPGPQPTDRQLANLDTADSSEETRMLEDSNSSRKKAPRLRWMSMASALPLRDGVPSKIFPLLESKDNWMDIMLVRQLISDRPFDAGHGLTMKAWDTCTGFLSKTLDPNDRLVHPTGISGKQLKTRFLQLMDFIKKVEVQIPLNPGCDHLESKFQQPSRHMLRRQWQGDGRSRSTGDVTQNKKTSGTKYARTREAEKILTLERTCSRSSLLAELRIQQHDASHENRGARIETDDHGGVKAL